MKHGHSDVIHCICWWIQCKFEIDYTSERWL